MQFSKTRKLYRLRTINSQSVHFSKFFGGAGQGAAGRGGRYNFPELEIMYWLRTISSPPVHFSKFLGGVGRVGRGEMRWSGVGRGGRYVFP